MGNLKTRYIFAIIMTLIGAVLVNAVEYETFHKAEDAVLTVKKIPINMGNWQGTDVYLEENIYDILETRAIIHRSYHFEGQRVFLSLVFYPETKVDFHAPEGCMAGSGRKINKSTKTIEFGNGGESISLGINQLTYEDGPQRDLVYYFYKAGNFVGNSYIHLRFSLAGSKLSGNGTSGALIRVSTPDKPIGNLKADERLINFICDLYPYLIQYL